MTEILNENFIKDFSNFFKNANSEEKLKIAEKFRMETGFELNVYKNPKPIIVAMVMIRDVDKSLKILGLKRGNSPHIGEVCLPGGYIDEMESAQMAAARELYEETNIKLNPKNFIVFESKISQRNTLMLFTCYSKVISHKDINWGFTNSENLGFVKIDKSTNLCFETHRQVCSDYWDTFKRKF